MTSVAEFEAMLAAEKFQPPVSITREPGYALADHAHEFDACALILSGAITLVVGGVATRYGAGDIFRLPRGTPHEESAGPEGVAYLSGRREAA
ncbi:MAG: cupin domain-containing protein [Pseudomonadota bacterium]